MTSPEHCGIVYCAISASPLPPVPQFDAQRMCQRSHNLFWFSWYRTKTGSMVTNNRAIAGGEHGSVSVYANKAGPAMHQYTLEEVRGALLHHGAWQHRAEDANVACLDATQLNRQFQHQATGTGEWERESDTIISYLYSLVIYLCNCLSTSLRSFQYIHSVIKSYVHLESTSKSSNIKDWQDLGFITTERSACTFAKGLMRNLSKDLEHTMPNETLERWLHVTPQFLQLWREVFAQLYTRHGGSRRTLVKEIEICILPQLCGASRIYKNKHTYIHIYSVLFSHNNR